MPIVNHVVETDFQSTFRTEQILGMFDVSSSEKLSKSWTFNVPIEGLEWSVGLIVGPSGSGKTTIANQIFGSESVFKENVWTDAAIVDDFTPNLSVKEITSVLSHVGLASPPSWLLPYGHLSNGQQFRADLARVLSETSGLIVFDEFTSVVDRTVAKIGSSAVQKYVRKIDRQFVAVSCHYDIAEWIEPDWVLDMQTETFTRRRLRRPQIKLQVQRCHHSAWRVFRGHHYLSAELNKASTCFVAMFEGSPVAFCAALPFPHGKIKNGYREHRTVVLPDFQGVGIGNRLSEHVGEFYAQLGKRFFSTTSHPAMVGHRSRSKRWVLKRQPSRTPKPGRTSGMISKRGGSNNRLTASFEYIPEDDRKRL